MDTKPTQEDTQTESAQLENTNSWEANDATQEERGTVGGKLAPRGRKRPGWLADFVMAESR